MTPLVDHLRRLARALRAWRPRLDELDLGAWPGRQP